MIGGISRPQRALRIGEPINVTAQIGSGWKAPSDGFLNIKARNTNGNIGSWYISENDDFKGAVLPTQGGVCTTCIPVRKGCLYKTMSSNNVSETRAEFYALA